MQNKIPKAVVPIPTNITDISGIPLGILTFAGNIGLNIVQNATATPDIATAIAPTHIPINAPTIPRYGPMINIRLKSANAINISIEPPIDLLELPWISFT